MNLSLSILLNLESVLPQMMARAMLLDGLRLMSRRDSVSEIDVTLRTLEERREIIAVTAEDAPGGHRYKITADGVARLREANL